MSHDDDDDAEAERVFDPAQIIRRNCLAVIRFRKLSSADVARRLDMNWNTARELFSKQWDYLPAVTIAQKLGLSIAQVVMGESDLRTELTAGHIQPPTILDKMDREVSTKMGETGITKAENIEIDGDAGYL